MDKAQQASMTERGERLIARLAAAGYARTEPSILQPAAIFLDLAGEDIRSRIFLTSGPEGDELCLRPEYTIPVCRAYLGSALAGSAASFSYLGPVFRQRPNAASEFAQAGLESFGRTDREAADAEILTLALDAASEAAARTFKVTFGDAGLFNALIEALALPPAWVRRIRRGHMRGEKLGAILAQAGIPATILGEPSVFDAVFTNETVFPSRERNRAFIRRAWKSLVLEHELISRQAC